MDILTVSASPYRLESVARIHNFLIKELIDLGFSVESAVWGHDRYYYMPEQETGEYRFESRRSCKLYLLQDDQQKDVKRIYDLIQSKSPKVILTIGDFNQVRWLSSIKQNYPELFKWVGILPTDLSYFSTKDRDLVDLMDEAIVTNMYAYHLMCCNTPTNVTYAHPGVDEYFNNKEFKDSFEDLSIIGVLRNREQDNVAAFVSNLFWLNHDHDISFHAHLHTDDDEYDIQDFISYCNMEDYITVTEKFYSIQEGPSDEWIRELYSNADIIFDTSKSSSTSLSILEAMSCGCIPVGPYTSANLDIVEELYGVSSYNFIRPDFSRDLIVSSRKGSLAIKDAYDDLLSEGISVKKNKYLKISKRFSRQEFVNKTITSIKSSLVQNRLVLPVNEL